MFEKIGKLKYCKFDRNEFDQFLGSATIIFERPDDAKKAIDEYHGASVDGKVLTVEFDKEVGATAAKVVKKVGVMRKSGGKTLRIVGKRR